MVGPFPCIIAEKGVGGLYLNCETVDIGTSTSTSGNKIEVWVKGKRVSTCKASVCTLNIGGTPWLSNIHPRALAPTYNATWKGAFSTDDKTNLK